MNVDVHQHIWTEPLLAALATRRSLPFVRRSSAGAWTLHCRGEQPYVIDSAWTAPDQRARLVHEEGLDVAVIALSSPIGIEALSRDEARELIEAHLTGVGDLGAEFAAWGPVALDDAHPDDVDAILDRGCVGVSIPATALAGPAALHAVGPLLERLAARGRPLLVHPGPVPGEPITEARPDEPIWWRALTDYVAQMQAAWLTFATAGRREHPDLIVVFAMLAAGAPLLSERLQTRGGPAVNLRDPRTYYDSSSYGPAAIEAMAERVGSDQLVYGSDRSVLDPIRTTWDPLLQANAARLLAQAGART
jgi:predicted TIM-barrel fold metal-dependent hydrolase